MPVGAPKTIVEPTPEERDLLVSLRKLIAERPDDNAQLPRGAQPETTPEASTLSAFWQFLFLFAIAVDISLLYLYLNQILGLEQNPLLQFLYKLLPVVGGTLLVSYVDKIRDWLLALTKTKWIGYTCLGFLPLLLALQMHFYRIYVDVPKEIGDLKILQNEKDKEVEVPVEFTDDDHRFLKVDTPDAYTLELGKGTYRVSPARVLLGTLAWLHCPDISKVHLEELHEVTLYSPADEGHLEVLAKDSPAMHIGQKASLLERSEKPLSGAPEQIYSWSKDFTDDKAPSIYLPSGTYDFSLLVEPCKNKLVLKDTVPAGHGAKLDVHFDDPKQYPCEK